MPEAAETKRFGTFNGVFVPCVVTIFGVILFLRVDFIVGTSGLFHALLILLVAEITTGLTGLSMSAISTNTEIGSGGPYYMIWRSLGAEVGAAVGVAFFLGRSVSIALYVLGFAETLVAVVGSPWLEAYSPVVALGADPPELGRTRAGSSATPRRGLSWRGRAAEAAACRS